MTSFYSNASSGTSNSSDAPMGSSFLKRHNRDHAKTSKNNASNATATANGTVHHVSASQELAPELLTLQSSLAQISSATQQSQSLLNSFAQKHKSLSASMDSFQEKISEWKITTVHVEETMRQVETIRRHFLEVLKLKREKPSVELLDTVIQLQQYFENKQSFLDASSSIEKLKELRSKTVAAIEDHFKKKIQSSERIQGDKELERMARRLHHLGIWSYRKHFVEARRRVLKRSLFGSKKTGVDMMKKVSNSITSAGMHKSKYQDRFYEPGTHHFIKLMDEFIEGLKREREVLKMMIFDTHTSMAVRTGRVGVNGSSRSQTSPSTSPTSSGGIGNSSSSRSSKRDHSKKKSSNASSSVSTSNSGPNANDSSGIAEEQKSVEQIFEDVVAKSKKKFFERAETIGDDVKQSERVFVLLDVLHHFEKRYASFDPIISREELSQFQKSLKHKISSYLEEYKYVIQGMSKSDATEPGQVHQATSNTFLLFHRLLAHEETVENLLGSVFFGESPRESIRRRRKSKSYFGRYMRYIMENATEKAIEQVGSHEKNKALRLLFFVNNHHYILEKLQSEAFAHHIQDSYVQNYEALYKNDMDEFIDFVWKPLQETVSNLQEIDALKTGDKKWRRAVKNRLKSFNSKFSAITAQHSNFKVSHAKTGSELRSAAEDLICDRYQIFYKKYAGLQFSKKNKEKYLEYKPETVRDTIRQVYR